MSQVIIETFNADWLRTWSDKNIEALLGFYTPDTVYKDVQTAAGLHGRDALGAYLEKLFSSTPPMVYTADATWVISGGYCGRWYCEIGKDGKEGRLRGFDLVLFRDGLISHNEVYVHQLDVAT